MRVIGTAGHVDHGKSTLVRALSGIDPDRLKEEKARGMTIDLGFAWITLPSLRANQGAAAPESVGIVDVPGHIDFIKNMLAGIGGIDAVLLVVAADEGVMPQTREHLAIVDLLAIPTGVVVLTKVDAVEDAEWLDLVELDVAALLEGTRLANAPVVRVSAQTGAGLDELRTSLAGVLGDLPPRRDRARPRLPVDRVFALTGFGTVVTGTLLDGALAVGESVVVLPQGKTARVRGLQTHKQLVEAGQPGVRLAVNLSGVDVGDIRRGDVLARPGAFESSTLFDAHVRLLAGAHVPLRHNAHVELYVGAAEVQARIRVLGGEQIEPGEEGWAQLHVAQPVVVVAGDHFILRVQSPSATVGGGVVLDPHPGHKWKRFDPQVLSRLQAQARGAPDETILDLLARAPFLTRTQVAARSELGADTMATTLEMMLADGSLLALSSATDPPLVDAGTWDRLVRHLQGALVDYHREYPLRKGISRGEARSRVQPAVRGDALTPRLFGMVIETCVAGGLVAADDERIWLADFTPTPDSAQMAAIRRTLEAFAAAPGAPPTWGETLALVGDDSELLDLLVAQGALLRLAGDVLFRRQDFEQMVELVRERLHAQGSITMAEARDLLGSTRKYVQALLEEMDARRITRRTGEARVLR